MIEFDKLPRNPVDALIEILNKCIGCAVKTNASYGDLRKSNHPIANDLFIGLTAARSAASRLDNPEAKEQILRNLELSDTHSLSSLKSRLEVALTTVVATQLDEHFLDPEAIELFDRAKLSADEKGEIRELLAKARRLADQSTTLQEFQRKKILHYIAKIEIELHKEKSTFQTFISAAYEVSGIAKQVGNDVQPIADAIQAAKTITERKIEGNIMIEREEIPKQLPSPEE